MSIDRIVRFVAGTMVLVGLALAHFVHPDWMWLSAFVGLSLAQSGLTGFCPMSFMLRKMGMNEEGCGC